MGKFKEFLELDEKVERAGLNIIKASVDGVTVSYTMGRECEVVIDSAEQERVHVSEINRLSMDLFERDRPKFQKDTKKTAEKFAKKLEQLIVQFNKNNTKLIEDFSDALCDDAKKYIA